MPSFAIYSCAWSAFVFALLQRKAGANFPLCDPLSKQHAHTMPLAWHVCVRAGLGPVRVCACKLIYIHIEEHWICGKSTSIHIRLRICEVWENITSNLSKKKKWRQFWEPSGNYIEVTITSKLGSSNTLVCLWKPSHTWWLCMYTMYTYIPFMMYVRMCLNFQRYSCVKKNYDEKLKSRYVRMHTWSHVDRSCYIRPAVYVYVYVFIFNIGIG